MKKILISILSLVVLFCVAFTVFAIAENTPTPAPAAPETDPPLEEEGSSWPTPPAIVEAGSYYLTEEDCVGDLETLYKRAVTLLATYDKVYVPEITDYMTSIGSDNPNAVIDVRRAVSEGKGLLSFPYMRRWEMKLETAPGFTIIPAAKSEDGYYLPETNYTSYYDPLAHNTYLLFLSMLDANPDQYVCDWAEYFETPEIVGRINHPTFFFFVIPDYKEAGYESAQAYLEACDWRYGDLRSESYIISMNGRNLTQSITLPDGTRGSRDLIAEWDEEMRAELQK